GVVYSYLQSRLFSNTERTCSIGGRDGWVGSEGGGDSTSTAARGVGDGDFGCKADRFRPSRGHAENSSSKGTSNRGTKRLSSEEPADAGRWRRRPSLEPPAATAAAAPAAADAAADADDVAAAPAAPAAGADAAAGGDTGVKSEAWVASEVAPADAFQARGGGWFETETYTSASSWTLPGMGATTRSRVESSGVVKKEMPADVEPSQRRVLRER
ncbi:unnamed protein product, partial [Laminaria digitata]